MASLNIIRFLSRLLDVDATNRADGRVLVWRNASQKHEYEAQAGGGGGGPPSGAAGGVLDGSYPDPGLAASVAGSGLSEAADVLAVNVDGTTIEIVADALAVKDGGITTAKLSFDPATQAELDAHVSDVSGAHDASAISVADTGGNYTATDVEGVLAEIAPQLGSGGPPSGAAGGVLDGSYPDPGLAAGVAGAGLAETADVLSVNVDGSTIEIAADTLRVKDGGITAAKVAADVATQAELDAHVNDTSAAHAANAISNTPAGNIAATDVQAALNELDTEKAASASAVMDGDTAGGVLSGTYPNPGFASDMATQAELDAHVNDTSAAHAASAISYAGSTNLSSTDVEAALDELDSEKTTAAAALTAAQTEIADQKRCFEILVSDPNGSAITTGDGKAQVRIPSLLNGHNLVSVGASVSTVSSSGIPTVQLRRLRRTSATAQTAADMLTTKLTIDASEFDSSDATTAAVIDTSNDDVQTGDQIAVDIDVAGTGAKGLIVTMTFEAP